MVAYKCGNELRCLLPSWPLVGKRSCKAVPSSLDEPRTPHLSEHFFCVDNLFRAEDICWLQPSASRIPHTVEEIYSLEAKPFPTNETEATSSILRVLPPHSGQGRGTSRLSIVRNSLPSHLQTSQRNLYKGIRTAHPPQVNLSSHSSWYKAQGSKCLSLCIVLRRIGSHTSNR